MRIASRRLGEFLVERRVLSRDALDALLTREADEGVHLSHLLVREKLVAEGDLMAAIASELGVPFVDLGDRSILGDVWALVPEDLARGYLAVAGEQRSDGVVVAMEDPSDETVINALEQDLGATVHPAVAVRADLESVIEQMYGPAPSLSDDEWEEGEDEAPAPVRARGVQLDDLLRRAIAARASDLHLTVGAPPCVRVDGELRAIEGAPRLNGSDVRGLVYGALTRRQRERFEEEHEISTSYAIAGVARFRVAAFVQRDSVGAVVRTVPVRVPAVEELGVPTAVEQLGDLRSGLVLVNGAHGSGTSTTLAALIDRVNHKRSAHILTIEDPIEFLHQHHLSIVNQREVGEDTQSFAEGLKHAMRQDPDVLLVGELPDLETIRGVLAAAETGKLVFATLRTRDVVSSINRMIEGFPVDQQRLMRVQLASVLRAVVVQQLIPGASGGRVLACEVLIGTPEARDTILGGDDASIAALVNARLNDGMQPMDRCLADLVKSGRITEATAREHAVNTEELGWLMGEHGR
jgi:twitching motility protein PilT